MGLAFLITSDKLQLLSERKVLKQSEYAATVEAAGLLDAARQEARRIEAQAQASARRQREQAYAQGLEQARIDHAAQCIRRADQERQQLGALRESMARLVTKAVSQFVAEADPAQVYACSLARVESHLRDEPFVSVRVAPGDEAALRRALAALQGAGLGIADAVVHADATLQAGHCVMHTASGTLDLGVQAQLEAFARALRQPGEAAS